MAATLLHLVGFPAFKTATQSQARFSGLVSALASDVRLRACMQDFW